MTFKALSERSEYEFFLSDSDLRESEYPKEHSIKHSTPCFRICQLEGIHIGSVIVLYFLRNSQQSISFEYLSNVIGYSL